MDSTDSRWFRNHLPTPTHTSTQDSLMDIHRYTQTHEGIAISAHMSMKQALMDQSDNLPDFARSFVRQSLPSYGQDSDAPSRKKRKLALVKCGRCRDDKVKCLPLQRIWPEKCERCKEKDLPCSEGNRAERKSKGVSTETLPSQQSTAESAKNADGEKFEDQFKDWAFLLSYKSNMAAAMDQMRHGWEDMLSPFMNGVRDIDFGDLLDLSSKATVIELTEVKLEEEMKCTMNRMIGEFSSTQFTKNMFSVLMGLNMMVSFPRTRCPVCSPAYPDSDLEALGECNEFSVRQKRLEEHYELIRFMSHRTDIDRLKKEVIRYLDLSSKVTSRTQDWRRSHPWILDIHGFDGMCLYHPHNVGLGLLAEFEEVQDCLGRSPLHYLLDDASRPNNTDPTVAAFHIFLSRFSDTGDQKRFVNDQDVLGRSPLHIASQGGLILAVQKLLELGADPGGSTTYNSTPLHYAAAKNYTRICEALLKYAVVDHVRQKDHGGHTAMGYAILYGHEEIQDMLTVYLRDQGEREDSDAPISRDRAYIY